MERGPSGADGSAAPPRGAAQTAQSNRSLADVVAGLLDDLRGSLHARAHLFSLEAKRAALAVGQMLAFGAVAAILLLTAWVMIVAGIVAGLIALGLMWPLAMLLAIAANLAAAFLLIQRIRTLANMVFFEASLRHLSPTSATAPTPAVRALDVQ